MYSPETLLQLHHLRHDDLVAAVARHARTDRAPRARRVPTLGEDVARSARTTVAGARSPLGWLRATRPSGALTGPAARRDPLCCPA